jgi:hypothetical protein
MSKPTSNSRNILAKLRELVDLMFFTPVIVFKRFSNGRAINLEVSPGDAPSKKTDTDINGS